jgi:organic radical activating enzyme
MTYRVKEIYRTIQGEGAQAGMAAVFLRFSGCNLWSGREEDRATAQCRFCDTDFRGIDGSEGGAYRSAPELAAVVSRIAHTRVEPTAPRRMAELRPNWIPAEHVAPVATLEEEGARLVVCTGGEPLLQLDRALIDALHGEGLRVAVETNGTRPAPEGLDWICVSPKAGTEVVLRQGDELKLVFPQEGFDLAELAEWDFEHHFLQPMDGPNREQNTRAALAACQDHPRWRLSLQLHKLLGIR